MPVLRDLCFALGTGNEGPACMTKALSMDLRERAMARLDAGETVRRVGDALSIVPSGQAW